MYKLCILQTHPVQYIVPWYQQLARHPEVDLTVFYCMLPTPEQQGFGFGVPFAWDIPLLEGYRYEVLQNRAAHPDTNRFFGCDTPDLQRLIQDGGYDACLVSGWLVKSCIQFLWASRRAGIPCIVRGESNSLKYRSWVNRLAHRLLLRQYAAFITIGKLNRQFYLDHGAPESRIIDSVNCVDSERIAAAVAELRPSRSAIRGQWGIPEDAYCLLFAGKFIKKKRPMDILQALAVLRADQGTKGPRDQGTKGPRDQGTKGLPTTDTPASGMWEARSAAAISPTDAPSIASRDVRPCVCASVRPSDSAPLPTDAPSTDAPSTDAPTYRRTDALPHPPPSTDAPAHCHTHPRAPLALLMVGDGELRAECEAYAREHNLPVTFAGFLNQSEMPKAYAVADCLVLPSDQGETWGMVVNEAMACGLPAIVSDRVGCHPDLIVPGVTGHTFRFGDTRELGAKMLAMAAVPDASRAMGLAAAQRVAECSIGRLVADTLTALQRVCEGG